MPKNKTNLNFILAALVGLFFFVLYLSTMPQTNVGYADSDELITVGYFGGAAHPPGYPLYVALTYIFTHLPIPFVSIAFKAHLVSVVLSSLSLSFIFLTAWKLYDSLRRPAGQDYVLGTPLIERTLTALVTTLTLGITTLYWLYGQIAEKYSLSIFLIAALLYTLTGWILVKADDSKKSLWLMVSLGLTGLAISHHQTMLALLPALLVVFWLQKKELKKINPTAVIKNASLFVAALVLPFLLLLLLQRLNPAVSWYFEPNLAGLKSMVLRYDFGGEIYQQGIEAGSLFTNINLTDALTAVINYALSTVVHWGWWLVPVFFLGLRFGINHFKKGYFIFLAFFAALGILMAGYLKWPADNGSQAIVERQYLAGYIPLALLMWFGWIELLRRLGKAGMILMPKKRVDYGLTLILALTVVIPLFVRYPQLNLKKFTLVHDQYAGILKEIEPNSILTCYSDVSCFALLYIQKVEGINPEVSIVPLTYPLIKPELAVKKLQTFTYETNPFLVLDVVTTNLDKRPVYAVNITDFFVNLYGIENAFMFYIPRGTYGELTRQVPQELPQYSLAAEVNSWKALDVPQWDKMRLFLKDNYAGSLFLNGYMHAKMGLRSRVFEELNQAIDIYFTMNRSFQERGSSARNAIERATFIPQFAPGATVPDVPVMLAEVKTHLNAKRNRQAYTLIRGALLIDPLNIEARLILADIYVQMGDKDFAALEYGHVLLLDPQNQIAQDKLDEL